MIYGGARQPIAPERDDEAKPSPLHAGFDSDPATKAVAVPIYQTVAYDFDSADHGAALFNLEVEGYRYTRIGNPTTDRARAARRGARGRHRCAVR